MTTNDDIEFGSMAEAAPRYGRRPDTDARYATVAIHDAGAAELPIFIDWDVARDIESHARDDVSVELGGVLLGGQFVDEHGQPFVVVTASLRARHYESTSGSFKFTHETWEAIHRDRAELPDDLQFVGWYHTHPGWGIFLSGLDLFICRNFFGRPSDVALVVDPCHDSRGWFHWPVARRAGETPDDPIAAPGYYLFTARKRAAELKADAHRWEAEPMPSFQRTSSNSGSPGPVVQVVERAPAWQQLAVLGVLTIQLVLVSALCWRIMASPTSEPRAIASESRGAADVKRPENFEYWLIAERERMRREAQAELMDRVLADLRDGAGATFTRLEESQQQLADLQASLRGQTTLLQQLETQHKKLQTDKEKRETQLESERDRWKKLHDELQVRFDAQLAEIAQMRRQRNSETAGAAPSNAGKQSESTADKSADTSAAGASPSGGWSTARTAATLAGVTLGLIAGGFMIWKRHQDALNDAIPVTSHREGDASDGPPAL